MENDNKKKRKALNFPIKCEKDEVGSRFHPFLSRFPSCSPTLERTGIRTGEAQGGAGGLG